MARGSSERTSRVGGYFHWIGRYPSLSREEESALTRGMQGAEGDRRREILIHSHLRFVVRIAGEYRNRGLPFEDLISEGNLGLLVAARRYDPDRGVRFMSFAAWWIRKFIMKALAGHSALVRVPEYSRRRAREVEAASGREDRWGEISRPLRIDARKAEQALCHRASDVPLEPDDERGRDRTLRRHPPLRAPGTPEESLIRRQDHEFVGRLLDFLKGAEREVIRLRFGVGGADTLSLKETGRRLGVSHERVRQIEKQAMGRLRKQILARRRQGSSRRRSRGSPPSEGPEPADLDSGRGSC